MRSANELHPNDNHDAPAAWEVKGRLALCVLDSVKYFIEATYALSPILAEDVLCAANSRKIDVDRVTAQYRNVIIFGAQMRAVLTLPVPLPNGKSDLGLHRPTGACHVLLDDF